MSARELFNGRWVFDPVQSRLSTETPRQWVQQIAIDGDGIGVREDITMADGSRATIVVDARFNAGDAVVSGSPVADTISYTRPDARTITGAGRKQGQLSLTESVNVSGDGQTLTVRYGIFVGGRQVANGLPSFHRQA